MKPDFSTLNLHALRCLDPYHKPPTYQISDSMGQGCFMDAPGYPTYFLRSVYTSHGNSPNKGATTVIQDPETGGFRVIQSDHDWKRAGNWDALQARIDKRIRQLWKPLPLEHPRVQAWIASCKKYFKNCYVDPRKAADKRSHVDNLKIGLWGVREFPSVAAALGIEVDPAVLDVCNGNEEQYSQEELLEVSPKLLVLFETILAKTDRATQHIQEFYPDYKYDKYTPTLRDGNWWEILAVQPTPETCPGEIGWGHPGYNTKHPVNGATYCQVCGWHAEGSK